AEDGIRDFHVTGVQTCALPISRQVMIEVTIAEVTLNDDTSFGISWFAKNGFGKFDGSVFLGDSAGGESPGASSSGLTYLLDVARSEERRVGKECRARGGAGQAK